MLLSPFTSYCCCRTTLLLQVLQRCTKYLAYIKKIKGYKTLISGFRVVTNYFNVGFKNRTFSFSINSFVFDVINCLQLLKCFYLPPYFKNVKYFSIKKFDFKEINMSDGQLLMIFCSIINCFVQIFLSSNFSLFGKKTMSQ